MVFAVLFFLGLQYFDPIKYVSIDVMHNLFLGTGKKMLKLWIDRGLLLPNQMDMVEGKVQCFKVPPDVGRIPTNVSSNYGGFTANQWCNWIIIYSPVVLKGLDQQHLQCWLLFVRACSLLSQRIISKDEVTSAAMFVLTFCKKFEELYGKDGFTPNMHLHMHLKQCLSDFGPSHSFWCFAFERFNGLLGSYSTNKKAIEVQVMRKVFTAQGVYALIPNVDSELQNILPVNVSLNRSLSKSHTDDIGVLSLLRMARSPLSSILSFENYGAVTMIPPFSEQVLSYNECQGLNTIYSQLYPNQTVLHVPQFYTISRQVSLEGEVIGSMKCGSASSVIMAYWPGRGNDLEVIDYSRMRVGVIQYFFEHDVTITSSDSDHEPCKMQHSFAHVAWKQRHPKEDMFGVSATLCLDLYEDGSPCAFLPVQRIACRCAHATLPIPVDGVTENLYIACPIPIKYSL